MRTTSASLTVGLVAALFATLLVAADTSAAQGTGPSCTATWSAPRSGNWELDANWEPAGAPGPTAVVCLPDGEVTVTVASPVTVDTIVVTDGATLAVTDDGQVSAAGIELIDGRLVNHGSVAVTASLEVAGTSELEGAPPLITALDLGPSLVVAGAPVGTVQVAGSVQLAGEVPPGLTVIVDHPTPGNQAALVLDDTVIYGTVVLRQDDDSGSSMLGTDQTVVNRGSIVVEGDGTGLFMIGGRLENRGELTIDARLVGTGCSTVRNVEGGTIVVREGAATAGFCLSPQIYEIDGGTLIVDGRLAATSVDVDGGRLTGTGIVAAPVRNTAGSVAPGAPIGTLSITGDYRQSGDGRLEIDIDGPADGAHDRLAVSAAAFLGGTLVTDSHLVPIDPVVVLSASTVSGSFDEMTGLPATWITRSAGSVAIHARATFVDVPLGHAFVWDIEWAAGRGIVRGHLDGGFRPRDPLSRQAWAVALYRMAGRPLGTDPVCPNAPFADVAPTHPACGEIAWAEAEGLTLGSVDGRFDPTRPVSRQALATMLHRWAGSPGGRPPPCAEPPFVDVPETHPACGPIAWARDQGVTAGYPDGTFAPTRPVSRQAAVAALHRFTPLAP